MRENVKLSFGDTPIATDFDAYKLRAFKQPLSFLIGKGKLAPHIPYLLDFLEHDFIQMDRKALLSFRSQLEIPSEGSSSNRIKKALKKSTAINFFLAVNDLSIETVYKNILHSIKASGLKINIQFYHFSGAKYFPEIIGLHPLMTFKKALYPRRFYSQVPLFVDNKDFYKKYPGHLKYISPEAKPLYHAFCVMLGNFPQHLIYEVQKNLPQGLSLNDFRPLIEQSVKNILDQPEFTTLSGPLVRKDQQTIDLHKSALALNPLFQIYQDLSNRFSREVENEQS